MEHIVYIIKSLLKYIWIANRMLIHLFSVKINIGEVKYLTKNMIQMDWFTFIKKKNWISSIGL